MTFQLSDDEAKLIFELFGSMSKSDIRNVLFKSENDPEYSEAENEFIYGSKLIRDAKHLAIFKMIDAVYDRLIKVYDK